MESPGNFGDIESAEDEWFTNRNQVTDGNLFERISVGSSVSAGEVEIETSTSGAARMKDDVSPCRFDLPPSEHASSNMNPSNSIDTFPTQINNMITICSVDNVKIATTRERLCFHADNLSYDESGVMTFESSNPTQHLRPGSTLTSETPEVVKDTENHNKLVSPDMDVPLETDGSLSMSCSETGLVVALSRRFTKCLVDMFEPQELQGMQISTSMFLLYHCGNNTLFKLFHLVL